MQLTNFALLAAALGASAHPSGHNHLHRSIHEAAKRDQTFVKAEHKVVTQTTVVPAAPAPTSYAPPAPTSSSAPASSSPSSGGGGGGYKPFCSGDKKRATNAQIAYTGNTGDGQWGCNIMLIDEDVADQYTYTSVYTNAAEEEHQVVCFNKIGPTGLINGFFGFSAVKFNLGPGEKQTVAFDKNTQGACAFSPKELAKTPVGQWAGSWVEFDFDNASNNGWSGADCSSLVAQAAGMTVPGCQVCHDDTCSTIRPGGHADNAYVKGMEAADGVGLNLPSGKVQLQVKVGFSG